MKRGAINITYEHLKNLLGIEKKLIITGAKHLPGENSLILFFGGGGLEHVEGAYSQVVYNVNSVVNETEKVKE